MILPKLAMPHPIHSKPYVDIFRNIPEQGHIMHQASGADA